MTSDRIEKTVLLSSSISRVWRAVSDSKEFGEWFRVKLDGPFRAGETVRGQITYPGYEHLKMELQVVELRPESYFAFRWAPNAVDANKDYSGEPTTLVEFELSEVPGGTRLVIVESGFDVLPAARREEAFRSNEGGWSEQLKNIERYVAQ